MYKTLNHILILLLISTIFSQQQYWNIREEIISRYDNENGYTITYYENGKIKEEINKEYEGNDDDWDDEW